MTSLKRAASEIKYVGFYLQILQDVELRIPKKNPTEEEILAELKRSPDLVSEYKELNVEYNISNIHLRPIDIETLHGNHKEQAQRVNRDIEQLKKLEKYTLDFEKSPVLVLIFSAEFFVLFSVQYFIVLLGWKEWQIQIYALFAFSIVVAWWYARKKKRLYDRNRILFEELYSSTLAMLFSLDAQGCIDKESLYIFESSEHI